MLLAVLTLMFLFASFALNAARYYNYKGHLRRVAREVAGYAGAFLPDPQRAYARAQDAFAAFSGTLAGGGEPLPGTLRLSVYQRSGDQPERLFDGSASGVQLPIHELRFVVEGRFAPRLLLAEAGQGRFADLEIAADARVRLAPTDVMIVLENSNSMLSALEHESADSNDDAVRAAFGMWDDDLAGSDPALYGGETRQIPKSTAIARQCFGRHITDVKRAALVLYDLLSSSGTFRVGVLPTLHLSGEFPAPMVRISRTASVDAYRRTSLQRLGDDPPFEPPDVDGPYGSFGHESTRCAALTERFAVPEHPLRSAVDPKFAGDLFRRSLRSELRCNGRIDSACDRFSHLGYSGEAALLPRELLWSLSTGHLFESGYPDPKYDYDSAEFALLRAADVLRSAPQRGDEQEVRRRVILLLTDGVDSPNEAHLGPDSRRLTRVRSASGGGVGWEIRRYAPGPNGDSSGESACGALSGPEPVTLGVLRYGHRQAFESADPFSRLAFLASHEPPSIAAAVCGAGSFVMEASPRTAPDSDGAEYFEQLAPAAARALFSAEVLE